MKGVVMKKHSKNLASSAKKKLESRKRVKIVCLSFGNGLSDIQLKEENLIFMVHLAAQSKKPACFILPF